MTASIKDVAHRAGVSPATVSRALGNGPVSPDLKRKVEAAVRETGYRPNLSARRLRSQSSQTIGLVVADIRNPFFTGVAKAVEAVAYANDLRVILCNTDEDIDKEAMYLRLMQAERVTGVIFAPTRPEAAARFVTDAGFPIVTIDREAPGTTHDAVVLDNREAARLLARHLVAVGFRHIAGIFGQFSTTGRERHEGYLAGLREAGLAPNARFIPPHADAAEAAVRALLDEGGACDAILVSNGVALLGAARAILASGRRIPEDLALAGFDNEPWTELVGPGGLTVVAQPVEEIGRTAMELLLDRLDDPTRASRKVALGGRLVVRGSTERGGTRGG